jgi:RHS repeat-associated protein
MNYDTIGNIKAKNQNHERLPYEGDSWIEQKGTTYDWTYDHEAKQPHAPTKIGNRTFTYDLNGNQTGWENTKNATNRVIRWDEENRISTITDNGHTSYYVYDAGGERSLKRTAQGETFYVNAYFVIREGEVASKHFFAGSQRIATKMTKQESQTVHGKGGKDKPVNIIYEKEQYFYHPDHLGSSSFVTDEKGKVYEHLEYFPYSEAFAHEHSNTQVTPYRFTGKELDEVTGLYYYGARYYDPRTSVWQSPDPILGEYMSGKTNGGVFNPKNLGFYSYTINNPINLIDPKGNSYIDNRILAATGCKACAQDIDLNYKYSVEKTDQAFVNTVETVSMVTGAGLLASFGKDAIKNSIKTGVNELKSVIKKLPENLMENKLFGVKSKLFGNESASKTRTSGSLNNKKSRIRIGWSGRKPKAGENEGHSVFRISIGKGDNTKHIDLFEVPNSIGNEIIKRKQKE